jgi:hypothetical protein
MRKISVIAILVPATVTSASALDVGVGAFYAPGKVTGYVDEVREYSDKEFSPNGLKGRVSLGVYEGLSVALGVGYNNFVYREDLGGIEEQAAVESIPMVTFTLGGDYAFPLRALRPFVGGGAAVARESAEAYGYSVTDWYGGVYAEAGARYFLVNGLAFEVAPRYTLLLDEPVVLYDDFNVHGFVRSEHHSQLAELLVGVNYYF